jgi:hypothetical protein
MSEITLAFEEWYRYIGCQIFKVLSLTILGECSNENQDDGICVRSSTVSQTQDDCNYA